MGCPLLLSFPLVLSISSFVCCLFGDRVSGNPGWPLTVELNWPWPLDSYFTDRGLALHTWWPAPTEDSAQSLTATWCKLWYSHLACSPVGYVLRGFLLFRDLCIWSIWYLLSRWASHSFYTRLRGKAWWETDLSYCSLPFGVPCGWHNVWKTLSLTKTNIQCYYRVEGALEEILQELSLPQNHSESKWEGYHSSPLTHWSTVITERR